MSGFGDAGSVYHAFVTAVDRYGPRPFLRTPAVSTRDYADGAIEYSYDQANESVNRLIAGYSAKRLSTGDRVALAFDSRLEVYLHLLALNALGVSIVPLNSGATDDELRHIVDHSDSRMIVSLPEYTDRLRTLGICQVFIERELTNDASGVSVAEPDDAREAALLYTSGTTGQPKGVVLTHR
ncbi:MAG: AMP-binding protein, partial [Woeseiaceae bacterium]